MVDLYTLYFIHYTLYFILYALYFILYALYIILGYIWGHFYTPQSYEGLCVTAPQSYRTYTEVSRALFNCPEVLPDLC